MKTRKYYWIKERINPQLGTYYVACGKMTAHKARAYETPLYGTNVMHKYPTKKAYEAELGRLRAAGERVQQ